MNNLSFKVKLPAVRVNAGMSQSEWASAIGVAPSTIYKWEKGDNEPSYNALKKMSELSGIPIDFIFVPEKS